MSQQPQVWIPSEEDLQEGTTIRPLEFYAVQMPSKKTEIPDFQTYLDYLNERIQQLVRRWKTEHQVSQREAWKVLHQKLTEERTGLGIWLPMDEDPYQWAVMLLESDWFLALWNQDLAVEFPLKVETDPIRKQEILDVLQRGMDLNDWILLYSRP